MARMDFFERRRQILTWLFGLIAVGAMAFFRSRWAEHRLFGEALFAAGLALAGLATVGRLWCSVYIAGRKSNTLVTAGPYSICRNPLYLFNLLGSLGIGLATRTLTFPAAILLAFALYYPFLIKREERRLRKVHGPAYADYCRRTPAFFPSFSLYVEPEEYTVRIKGYRRSMVDALWFVWIVGLLGVLGALQDTGVFPTYFSLY